MQPWHGEDLGASALAWRFGHQHHQLEVGPVGERKGDLLVAEASLARMLKDTFAAGAIDHGMLGPAPSEERTSAAQILDHRLQLGGLERATGIGAELGQHAACPRLPVGNDLDGYCAHAELAAQ